MPNSMSKLGRSFEATKAGMLESSAQIPSMWLNTTAAAVLRGVRPQSRALCLVTDGLSAVRRTVSGRAVLRSQGQVVT